MCFSCLIIIFTFHYQSCCIDIRAIYWQCILWTYRVRYTVLFVDACSWTSLSLYDLLFYFVMCVFPAKSKVIFIVCNFIDGLSIHIFIYLGIFIVCYYYYYYYYYSWTVCTLLQKKVVYAILQSHSTFCMVVYDMWNMSKMVSNFHSETIKRVCCSCRYFFLNLNFKCYCCWSKTHHDGHSLTKKTKWCDF